MPTLWIFNPDTDFAKGVERKPYTPTKKVREMRRQMALCQLPLAKPDDFILIVDSPSPTSAEKNLCLSKKINILELRDINKIDWSAIHINPWGWDHAIRRLLLVSGVPESTLPSEEYIETVRRLSHRSLTIPFHRILQEQEVNIDIPVPIELKSISKVEELLQSHSNIFLKAPWSSSGRGILHTKGIGVQDALNWARGVIKRQGSIIAEYPSPNNSNFATEWWLYNKEVRFLGFSHFTTNPDGRYLQNLDFTQKEIIQKLSIFTTKNINQIVNAQEYAIKTLILPSYSGPLGIDMLGGFRFDPNGKPTQPTLNACIEINLRTTMGHLALARTKPLLDVL